MRELNRHALRSPSPSSLGTCERWVERGGGGMFCATRPSPASGARPRWCACGERRRGTESTGETREHANGMPIGSGAQRTAHPSRVWLNSTPVLRHLDLHLQRASGRSAGRSPQRLSATRPRPPRPARPPPCGVRANLWVRCVTVTGGR